MDFKEISKELRYYSDLTEVDPGYLNILSRFLLYFSPSRAILDYLR